MAFKAWQASQGSLSMAKAGRTHGISYSTLYGRIHGAVSRKEDAQRRQRLSLEEERCLVLWVQQLEAWGWLPRVEQLRRIAIEMLESKKDYNDLGINWTSPFL